jgi:ABC-type antimicrobial peptide transport system permease subunit
MFLQVDPRLNIKSLTSVSGDFDNAAKNQIFGAVLAAVIALVSLLMVVAGIAGMVSYMLAIRRYDMGVKMAMGATNEILFVDQIKSLSAPIGVAMIFASSLMVFFLGYSRTVPEWVFDVSWSMGFYTLLLIVLIATLSCVIPTLKILHTNPISALRNQ